MCESLFYVHTISTCQFNYHCTNVDASDVLEKSIWLTFFIQKPFVILSLPPPNHTLSLPRRIHQFPQIGHRGIINANKGMCSLKRAYKYKYLNNLCSSFFFFTVLESTQPATVQRESNNSQNKEELRENPTKNMTF